MSKDGKTVHCVTQSPDGPVEQWVHRTLCLVEAREECPTCPHRQFSVRFRLRVADQLVACPRWRSEEERQQGKDPVDYVTVQRDTCTRLRPFPFCEKCPNSNPAESPRSERRWVQEEARRRRIELELDEEERSG